ncbi:MAG: phospholipid carrier-dependent glycosyltransferase [Lutibacter sp.]|uniref:ArnT family glycosyltransferase n=1 Tax=Lutibacter sp. TaxID=1925666 RepID=UPI00179B94E1|nr:glycosyltransferase family 39 protein [Lutibacter sp.]MBT8316984.1 glycosyltransferase family 39 protein [Lutibacter sp.]NNJ57844.1 phospholipid carrier-dependent glycosyltransferase [Lutibacter sp.]
MIKTFEKYPLATIVIIFILMLLIQLEVPNVTIMEARNFITAREMVLNDHWLLTTLNGEPRYHKPPLPTWITAISGMLFGLNNLFALRLPAALMVLFISVSMYYFSLKLTLSKKQSFLNSLILMTSFYIVAITNEAPVDIFTHGFILAGLYFLFMLFKEKHNSWKNAIVAGIFIGFSILSKGPVSLYAVFLPFLIAFGIVFKYQNFNKKILQFILLIILFLIIGSWWFIYVRMMDPEIFLRIASVETTNWSMYNVKPFYYYWSFFTQSGLWTIPAFISLIYPYVIKKVTHKKVYKFSFWWTISAVILLSIIPEKKARYLVPVLIPLAINIGFYIQYLIANFSKLTTKKETYPVYFNFGLIAFVGILFPVAVYIFLKNAISSHLTSYVLTSIALVLIGSFILRNLYVKNMNNVFYLTIAFMVATLSLGLPMSKSLNKNIDFTTINTIHELEKEHGIKTYSIGNLAPEIIWIYKGVIKNIYKNDEIDIPETKQFGLLMLNDEVGMVNHLLKKHYTLKLLKTYNFNVGSKNKERLIRQFYLVSKK